MRIYQYGASKNLIGQKIRKLRLEQKLTQADLAKALQLKGYEFSDLTILRIEKGTRFVPDYEVKIFADYFNVPYTFLLDEEKK